MNPEQKMALTHRDERGKMVPHKLSPFVLVEVAIVAGVRARLVPPQFWSEDVADDGATLAVVACPCGTEPQVPELEVVKCSCERFYFHGSESVWAFNGPAPSPSDASLPED